MVVFKKLLLLVVVSGAALALILWTFAAFEFQDPIFAFLVNWLVMSWAAIVGQFIHFPAFGHAFYEIRPFERSGRIYERLGVRLFKKIVRRGPLAIFSPTLRFPARRTVPGLLHLEYEMRKAETSHAVIFLLIILLAGYALSQGALEAVFWLLVFNILFNGYPVMLQRYNRIKLQEFLSSGLAEP